MRKEYQHSEYDLTIVERSLYGPRDVDEFVEIPHTHTGYGASAIELSNDRYLESDTEMWGRLNIDNHGTMFWYANVRDYTDEQWEELEELVTGLNDYPVLCDMTHSEVDEELKLDHLRIELDYDATVDEGEVLDAIHDLGLSFYDEGHGNYWITQDDFDEAVKHAEAVKAESVPA